MRGLNPHVIFSNMVGHIRDPSGFDRDGPGTREIPGETRRKVPTRSYTL